MSQKMMSQKKMSQMSQKIEDAECTHTQCTHTHTHTHTHTLLPKDNKRTQCHGTIPFQCHGKVVVQGCCVQGCCTSCTCYSSLPMQLVQQRAKSKEQRAKSKEQTQYTTRWYNTTFGSIIIKHTIPFLLLLLLPFTMVWLFDNPTEGKYYSLIFRFLQYLLELLLQFTIILYNISPLTPPPFAHVPPILLFSSDPLRCWCLCMYLLCKAVVWRFSCCCPCFPVIMSLRRMSLRHIIPALLPC